MPEPINWADYVTDRVLKPLGMTASLPLPRPNSFGLATGYGARVAGRGREQEEFTDCKGIAPAASLAIARLRISIERGRVIAAGLHPASNKNQKSAGS